MHAMLVIIVFNWFLGRRIQNVESFYHALPLGTLHIMMSKND